MPVQTDHVLVGELRNGQVQVHTLDYVSGGKLKLKLTHPAPPGMDGLAIELQLIDAANNVVAQLSTRRSEEFEATVPAAGTYYLRVRDGDSSTTAPGSYRLDLSHQFERGITYDGGANNSSETAIHAPPGELIVGRLDVRDSDYFRIDADAGGVLRLQFQHPGAQSASGRAIGVTVTDRAGETVLYRSLRADGALETTLPAAGDYYLKVHTSSGSTPERALYALAYSLVGQDGIIYDGPANDTPAGALALPQGRTAVGKLDASDLDYFRIEAKAPGRLSLNFQHPEGVGADHARVRIELVDANSRVWTAEARGNKILNFDLPNSGSYFLKLANTLGDELPGLYKLMAALLPQGREQIVLAREGSFTTPQGDDVVHGSAGRDVLTGLDRLANYAVSVSPAGTTLVDKASGQGSDTLFNVERLQFADRMVAIDLDGNGGRLFRLYQAAFDRPSDETGLGFWIHQLDRGEPLRAVAWGFIQSGEFRSAFGDNPTNRLFVHALYDNVLHRDPDAGGVDYWVRALEQGALDRADVLIAFADSEENIAQVVGATGSGIVYQPWAG